MVSSSHGGLLAVLDGGLVVMVCKLQQHEQGSGEPMQPCQGFFSFLFRRGTVRPSRYIIAILPGNEEPVILRRMSLV